MKSKFILLYLVILGVFLTGCATTTLETNAKMTKSVFLKPNNALSNHVYLSMKNMTEDNLELLPKVTSLLEEKGYKIVTDSKDADYGVFINILFANNLKEAYALKNAAGLGVTTGFIAAAGGTNTRGSLLVGATVALASGLVTKALEDEIYRAVIDVVIDERSDNPSKEAILGEEYKEHSTRLLVEAVKTNLKLDEALPILSQKASEQIAKIF